MCCLMLSLCYFVTVAVAGAQICQGMLQKVAGDRVHNAAGAFMGADLRTARCSRWWHLLYALCEAT